MLACAEREAEAARQAHAAHEQQMEREQVEQNALEELLRRDAGACLCLRSLRPPTLVA